MEKPCLARSETHAHSMLMGKAEQTQQEQRVGSQREEFLHLESATGADVQYTMIARLAPA